MKGDNGELSAEILKVIGPVMIGPSSSHTAGPLRLGRAALALLGEEIASARIILMGSLAATGRGHGTPEAAVAGLLGMESDDRRVPRALGLARERGLEYEIVYSDITGSHANELVFQLRGTEGATVTVQGASLGGGEILLTAVDGFEVSIDGRYPTLVVFMVDRPGLIASVSKAIGGRGMNIAFMSVSRKRRGQDALMSIELDHPPDDNLVADVRGVEGVAGVRFIPDTL
ncbi:MAG: serine dehydratase beta chain [Bacillota bacterium]